MVFPSVYWPRVFVFLSCLHMGGGLRITYVWSYFFCGGVHTGIWFFGKVLPRVGGWVFFRGDVTVVKGIVCGVAYYNVVTVGFRIAIRRARGSTRQVSD